MTTSSIITVGPTTDADVPGNTCHEIQAAVDRAAASGGGEIRILPGVYNMEDSLHLRSGVRIVGAGENTILRKSRSASSPISTYLGYGHYDVSVTDPDKFHVGMGVHVCDDRSGGFYDTVATLVRRAGNRFGIDRMLNHDYAPTANGRVTSVFPVISGCHIRTASVEALSIDGNKTYNDRLNGCRGGGVFLQQAHDVALCGLRIRDFNGDGISFQQCRNTVIQDCLVEGMTGHGLHPGSGSVGSQLLRNTCRDNEGDGVFYCLRVTFSLCKGNIIEKNHGCGISIGGRDTDNWFKGNCIRNNGRSGIYFRKADRATAGSRNLLDSNILKTNCRQHGDAEIEIDGETADIHITGNTVCPGAREGRQLCGVRIGVESGLISIWDNTDEDGCGLSVDNRAGTDALRDEPPVHPLPVGPDAAPADADAHLGTL